MKYVNAKEVLPPDILALVQEYSGGALIYVPKKDEEKIGWGQKNGTRTQMHVRNNSIIDTYRNGSDICELMLEYSLSEASIRKILYSKSIATA